MGKWRDVPVSGAMPALLLAQIAALGLADAGALSPGVARGGALALFAAAALLPSAPRILAMLAALGLASGGEMAERREAAAADRILAEGTRTVEARVLARELRDDWIRLDLAEVQGADGGPATPRALRLQGDAGETLTSLQRGDRLRVRVALEPPSPRRNPGGPDAARGLARRGVGGVARPVDPLLAVRVAGLGRPEDSVLEDLRHRAGERLSQEGQGGELLRALACGARAGLSLETRLAFGELGLAHVLSVSGLHLVLVAGLCFAVAARGMRLAAGLLPGRDSRRAALALAIPAAATYAVFSGFEVPVQRSLAMVLAGGIALVRRRPVPPRRALIAAAAWVLVAAPEALFDAGAQMSFAASAALLWLRREPRPEAAGAGRWARLVEGARTLLSASAAAGAATAPLAATHIGVLSPAGLLANLLFVPWTGLVVLPASLLAAAASLVPAAAERGGQLEAGRDVLIALCAKTGALTCVLVLEAARWLPDPPPVPAPRTATCVACGLLAWVAVRGGRLLLRTAACVASTLLLALVPPAPVSPEPPRVVFLDVGQGDATVVQGRKASLLVDAGLATPRGPDLGRSVVVPALAALGACRLDVVAVTHADADHAGGVGAVFDACPVGALWLPAGAEDDVAFDSLRARAQARRVPVRYVSADTPPVRLGDLLVTPLAPSSGAERLPGNDGSLVLRVDLGGRRILLPGDLEARGEGRLLGTASALPSDVLKLAHHGSRTSSTAPFLEAASPRLAVVSAGCGGRFGMPHPEVVVRLESAGIPWVWTGRDGAVLVGLDGRLPVRRLREEAAACTPGQRRHVAPRKRPTKRGRRFSTKARRPLRASSLRRSGRTVAEARARIGACLAAIRPGRPICPPAP